MKTNQHIKVGLLKPSEVEEADRIVRLAFGMFLGLPNPLDFMGDRHFMAPRWGSFAFFGLLTVLPEYWDRGVAPRLLEATMGVFEHPGSLSAWTVPRS
jgi:hypothetical protein